MNDEKCTSKTLGISAAFFTAEHRSCSAAEGDHKLRRQVKDALSDRKRFDSLHGVDERNHEGARLKTKQVAHVGREGKNCILEHFPGLITRDVGPTQ